ncbi:serine hydrolase domain-containing protein [Mycetocola saprophilus]|uniref:serine hydrolase domain-containing protein n=1 Tax=Mycetocola saprophilus TaxID=76636 RepID=UPI003BF232DA
MNRQGIIALGTGVAALLIGSLALPNVLAPSTEKTGDQALATRLSELAAESTEGQYHHLSAAIITPEGTTFAGLGADENTEMEIGSVTKTMTSLLLAQAAQSGAVALDDRAGDHLPLGDQPFTLEDLATHRSGLPRIDLSGGNIANLLWSQVHASDPYSLSVDELAAVVREAPLEKPGTVSYSNMGVGTLGQAVAAAQGLSYRELLQRDVFDRLGMTASSLPVTPDNLGPDARGGYTETGRPAKPWTVGAEAPSGGARSTATDMARYARALLTDDAALGIPAATVLDPRHEVGEGADIGLAWFVTQDEGRTITWHNGGTGGHRTFLVLDREARKAVYVIGDTTASVDGIGLALLREENNS